MQIKYIVGIAVITALVTTALMVPMWAQSSTITVVYEKQPKLTPAQMIWLAKLMQCESGIKASAINPKDLDNTPSYGILQFKPSTFTYYATKYNIKGELMDGEAQVGIVEQWLLRGVSVVNQFPDCVRKLGAPPSTDSQN